MIRACLARFSGVVRCESMRKPDGFHAELAGVLEVLDGDVGFGAVGGDAGHGCAGLVRLVQVVDGAQAREHQHRDLGVFRFVHGGPDQVQFRGEGEPVVEGGPAQAVAVGDFDDLDLGVVQGADHGADVRLR